MLRNEVELLLATDKIVSPAVSAFLFAISILISFSSIVLQAAASSCSRPTRLSTRLLVHF